MLGVSFPLKGTLVRLRCSKYDTFHRLHRSPRPGNLRANVRSSRPPIFPGPCLSLDGISFGFLRLVESWSISTHLRGEVKLARSYLGGLVPEVYNRHVRERLDISLAPKHKRSSARSSTRIPVTSPTLRRNSACSSTRIPVTSPTLRRNSARSSTWIPVTSPRA